MSLSVPSKAKKAGIVASAHFCYIYEIDKAQRAGLSGLMLRNASQSVISGTYLSWSNNPGKSSWLPACPQSTVRHASGTSGDKASCRTFKRLKSATYVTAVQVMMLWTFAYVIHPQWIIPLGLELVAGLDRFLRLLSWPVFFPNVGTRMEHLANLSAYHTVCLRHARTSLDPETLNFLLPHHFPSCHFCLSSLHLVSDQTPVMSPSSC